MKRILAGQLVRLAVIGGLLSATLLLPALPASARSDYSGGADAELSLLIGNRGSGVKVAILDTGVDLHHPDLKIAGSATFVEGTCDASDDNGHGTMVAGIIGGQGINGGVAGVAPDASLYAVKVLRKTGSGSCASIQAGLEWAIANDMDIINMSFGGTMGLPHGITDAMQRACDAGILLVSGVGNDGHASLVYAPARYPTVIAVGAVDKQNVRAPFSNHGKDIELMAPGVDILSTTPGGGYRFDSSTSVATPYVTGVAALVMAAGVTNGLQVRTLLGQTAIDLGAAGYDNEYGFGLVSTAAALAAVRDGRIPAAPTLQYPWQ